MIPDVIRTKRDDLATVDCQVNWCDDEELNDENRPGVSPGGDVNPFGWYVVGTTVGGNAVVVQANEPGVYFADHEWCGDGTEEGTRRELIPLAPSIEELRRSVEAFDSLLDDID